MGEVLLEVRNLTKVFPGTVALEDVNIQFNRGEIHGIIGKNGAGKSTLLNILSGILAPSSGQIIVRGIEHARLNTAKAKREGITIVTQKPEVVPDFTVVQNLFLPRFIRGKLGFLDWKRMREETDRIFAEAGLRIDCKRRMRDLSLDEEQVFLLLKAFGVDKKEFILLDEVTTSFSRKEQEFFYQLIEDQKRKGNLIIFISHRLDEMMRICDRVTVLRDGKAIGTLEKAALSKEVLARMIVGGKGEKPEKEETFSEAGAAASAPAKKLVLGVRGFSRAGYFQDVSFDVHEGEIVGLAGLVGSGRTELLRAIQGIDPAEQGTLILHNGRRARFTSSRAAIHSGIVYLTENRDEDGLINNHSVRKNLTLSYLLSVAKRAWIRKSEEEKTARPARANIGNPHQLVGRRCAEPERRKPAEGTLGTGGFHQRQGASVGRAHQRDRHLRETQRAGLDPQQPEPGCRDRPDLAGPGRPAGGVRSDPGAGRRKDPVTIQQGRIRRAGDLPGGSRDQLSGGEVLCRTCELKPNSMSWTT